MAKNEVLDREVNTQKEIMKQFEQSKKEYVAKLKNELDTVEARFLKVINENNMVGEDYRSQAYINFHKYLALKVQTQESTEIMDKMQEEIFKYKEKCNDLEITLDIADMETEDRCAKIRQVDKELTDVKQTFANFDEEIKNNRNKIRGQETRIETLEFALKGAHESNEELQEELEEAKALAAERVSPSRLKDLEDGGHKETLEAAVQTELGMEDLDRARSSASFEDGTQGSNKGRKTGGKIVKQGRLSKQGTEISNDLNKDSRFLNQNSSTAMGTNQHGQSLHIDTLDAGLKHNTSLDQTSPGMKSRKSGGGANRLEKNSVIEEEDDPDMVDMDGNPIKKSIVGDGGNGFPSVMSGQGLRSDQTLPNNPGE